VDKLHYLRSLSEYVNKLDAVLGFNEETRKVFNNTKLFDIVSESLLAAEKDILALDIQLAILETENIKFQKIYFPEYNKAKGYLRETKQELRRLAHRTVTDVRDLKLLLNDIDETEDTFFLKRAIDKMKDLMIETLKSLKEARVKYNSAVDTFATLNSSIKIQNLRVKELTDIGSAKYKDWTSKTRAGVYGAVSATTVGLIIADIFGCLGICSSVGVVVSGLTAVQVESAIKLYGKELEELKEITYSMLSSGKYFDKTINAAIDQLTEEIELIDNWATSADVVRKNIDKYPQEFLRKYQSIRTVFRNGLDDLRGNAEKFLAQPIDIL